MSRTGEHILGPWLVTVGILMLTTGGRRLPIGVSEGLFVGGISGLLLLTSLTGAPSADRGLSGCASLIGLAVLWFLAAAWIERRSRPEPEGPVEHRPAVRRDLAAYASSAAGLAAWSGLLTAEAGTSRVGRMLTLSLLLLVAAAFYLWRRASLARYAAVAMLVTLVRGAVPWEWVLIHQGVASRVFLLVGAALLILVVATALLDWRQRVRIWQTEPHRLTEPPPRHRVLYSFVLLVAATVGVAGVVLAKMPLTPLAVAAAAYASLVVGHRSRWDAAGELGLALGGQAVVTAAVAWLPFSPANVLLGCGLAGAHMSWLAGFWEQQLDEGRPWTTTGRLIPVARHLGYAAAAGQLAFAIIWLRTADLWAVSPGWQAAAAALVVLLHWWLLVGQAQARGEVEAAGAACLALVAALVPIHCLAAGHGLAWPAGLLLAAAGLILAIRTASQPRTSVTWVWNAQVGGLLPAATAYDLVARRAWATDLASLLASGLMLLVAGLLRWSPLGFRLVAGSRADSKEGGRSEAS